MIITTDIETLDGELSFKDGDLQIFNSSKEHASALVEACKNEWKQYPTTGLDLQKNTNSAGQTKRLEIQQDLSKIFVEDGFSIQDLKVDFDISTNKLIIKSNATRYR